MPCYYRRVSLSRLLFLLSIGVNFCVLLLFRQLHEGESPRRWSFPLVGRGRTTQLENSSLGHHLCIVVPFRNRFEELIEFVPHIHRFLLAQHFGKFSIIVVNQRDRYRFNRASLINVGFFESRSKGCDYFAMHDVDLLPLNLNLSYHYPDGGVYHVSAPEYHPLYHYSKYVGGVLIVTLETFALVNGMSNRCHDHPILQQIRAIRFAIYMTRSTANGTCAALEIKRLKHEKGTAKLFSLVNVALYCDVKSTPWCHWQ